MILSGLIIFGAAQSRAQNSESRGKNQVPDLTEEGAIYAGLHSGFGNGSTVQTHGSSSLTDSNVKTVINNFDGDLGYVFSTGIYVGGTYWQDSTVTTTNGTAQKTNLSAFGASFGYMAGGWIGLVHYYLSNVYRDETASNTWVSPTSFGVDAGYAFRLWGPLRVGGLLAYRSSEFRRVTDSTGTGYDADLKVTSLDPKLVLELVF